MWNRAGIGGGHAAVWWDLGKKWPHGAQPDPDGLASGESNLLIIRGFMSCAVSAA